MRIRTLLASILLLAVNAFSAVTFTSNTLPASGPTVNGDFNRDGFPDIAVLNTNGDGALYVYFGIGNGNFNLAYVDTTVPSGMTDMHTADLNNNGILDLVITSNQSKVGHIWYGNANGNFTAGPNITFARNVQNVQLGDVNNDGKVDIVATECASLYTLPCQIETKLNKGGGVFATSQALALTQAPVQSTVADINRDGKLDYITDYVQTVNSPGKLQVFRGNGNGTFSASQIITLPVVCTNTNTCYDNIGGFVVADFYNDTNLHIVVAQNHYTPSGDGAGTSSLYTYKNNGAGTFTLAHTTTANETQTAILAADLNVDQKQDLLVNNGAVRVSSAYFFLGNGNGTFQSPVSAPWNVADGGLDFTRDFELTSRPDVVSTAGPYAGPFTLININTTNARNCPPPGSGHLAAKVCTPANGAKTASTSVTVRGSGNSPAGIKRLEIWIDGTKRGQRWSDQIAETFTLSAGKHVVTVVAVDQYVGTAKSTSTITVP
jgi:hypothetical protein